MNTCKYCYLDIQNTNYKLLCSDCYNIFRRSTTREFKHLLQLKCNIINIPNHLNTKYKIFKYCTYNYNIDIDYDSYKELLDELKYIKNINY